MYVQGRLLTNSSFWENELEAPQPIVECIKEGYKLLLLSPPENHVKPNHRSAQQNKKFVNEAIANPVNSWYVQEVKELPHICSPLSVVTSSSNKKRLVIDLRHLNQNK